MRIFGLLLLSEIVMLFAPSGFGQTAVLSFPTSEGKFGYFENGPSDTQNSNPLTPGQTAVVYDAVFSGTTPRNPSQGYNLSDNTLVAWPTPAFYGGYRLTTTNNSNGNYLPNFVRGVTSPTSGVGYATLPLTQILALGNSGTLTNTISGAFVTPTAISGAGTFQVTLPSFSLNGATGQLRGVIFDGTQWLVTDDFASIPANGGATAVISTSSGWRVLNTVDFSFSTGATTPSGNATYSGLWFQATQTSAIGGAQFSLNLSNVTFSAIPEPSSLGLLAGGAGLAMACVGAGRRRRTAVKRQESEK